MRSESSRVLARGRLAVALVVALLALVWCTNESVWAGEWPCHMVKEVDGDTLMDQYGFAVVTVRDMDWDGSPDYIVGAPSGLNTYFPPPYAYVRAGFVRVFSTRGDSLLYELNGSNIGDRFGYSVAGGADINNDDPYYNPDFVVGAPGADPSGRTDAGRVYVYNGEDGTLNYTKDGSTAGDAFGSSVAIASPYDWNMGSSNYLLVGAPRADIALIDNGAVYVYQASDGSYYNTLAGNATGDQFGTVLANIGYGPTSMYTFVVGVPYAAPGGQYEAGSVYYCDIDGSTHLQLNGTTAYEHFGMAVANARDINLDGFNDFIVGAPGASPGGLFQAGCVYVYSATDGSLILQINGTRPYASLGTTVAAAGDVNGDGWPDIMAGSLWNNDPTASAVVYSGRDGSPLVHIPPTGLTPAVVAGGLYANYDSRADFLIGDFYSCGKCLGIEDQYTGTVYLFESGYGETIQSITDVGNDQGRQVRIEWKSLPANDNFVKEFAIYRRVDDGLKSGFDPYGLTSTPPGTWDFVQSIPARGDSLYSAVVATLADSTESTGTVWSAFFVSALGDNPLDHFDSPVDSGYSIDNLAPAPPPALLAELSGGDVALDWGPVDDADFDFYWVYRDVVADFALDVSKRIGSTSDTSFLDTSVPGQQPYYKVCAVDFAGNESDPSNEATVATCSCPYQCDYDSDGFLTSLDLGDLIDVLFAGAPEIQDPNCPTSRGDFDNDGFPTSLDLGNLIDHLFAGGLPPINPCAAP